MFLGNVSYCLFDVYPMEHTHQIPSRSTNQSFEFYTIHKVLEDPTFRYAGLRGSSLSLSRCLNYFAWIRTGGNIAPSGKRYNALKEYTSTCQ